MSLGRVLALAGSNIKRAFREPSYILMVMMFPIALTVLFGTAFGAMGGGETSYSVGVIDLDGSVWSEAFASNLSSTGIISVRPFDDLGSVRTELSQGGLSAAVVIPAGFGASCQSFIDHPADRGMWTSASVQLLLDPGSMISTQAVPSLVGATLDAMLGTLPSASPVTVSSSMVTPGERLSMFDLMAPGVITFSAIFITMIVGESFAIDRERGVLRRIATTSATSGEFILSHLMSNMVLVVLQASIVFILLEVLGFQSAASPAGVAAAFLLVLLFSVSTVGFGLITAAVSKSAGQATGMAFLFIMPQMFLGTFMGVALSPAAQSAGMMLPAYYATDGLTTILLRGGALDGAAVLTDVLALAMFGAAIIAVGAALFDRYGRR